MTLTTHDDADAKRAARKLFFTGYHAALDAGRSFTLEEAHDRFERHWRFVHCSRCGLEIHDQDDVGNVDVDGSSEVVTSSHKVCPPPRTDALAELREAWIEMPFDGAVPAGWGGCVQRLVLAAGVVVDPDRTLREDPEVKRRGSLAGYRQRHAFMSDQVRAAENFPDILADWTARRDQIAAECLAEHGVQL